MALYNDTFAANLDNAPPTGWTPQWYTAGRGYVVRKDAFATAGSTDAAVLKFAVAQDGPQFNSLWWNAPGTVTDGELVVRVQFGAAIVAETGSKGGLGLRLRTGGTVYTGYGYFCHFENGNLVVSKWVAGAYGVVDTEPFALVADVWIGMRFRIDGNRLRAKAWLATNAEPEAWTIDTIDSGPSPGVDGAVGIYPGYTGVGGISFDEIGFGSGADVPEIEFPEAPVNLGPTARPVTEDELTILGMRHVGHYLWVEVEDADGIYRDLSDLLGADWLDGAEWGVSGIDQPVIQGTVSIRRDALINMLDDPLAEVSMSPLMEESPLNRNLADEYAPFIQPGRRIRIVTAVTPNGDPPTEGDRKEMLVGKIDRVAWPSDPVTIDFRDLGAFLQQAFIETPKSYDYLPSGAAMEVLLQEIIDDNVVEFAPTVVFDTISGQNILAYDQDQESVMDAVRNIVAKIGWDIRYMYGADDVFRFRLYEPDRVGVNPDFVLDASIYENVNAIEMSDDDIRNKWKVIYTDAATGAREFVEDEDAASIALFRSTRYAEIEEAGNSPINSAIEATRLLNAAMSDTSTMYATQELTLLYWWPVQIGNVVKCLANGVHYSSDLTQGVVGYKHSFANGTGTTTLTLRGKPAGAFRRWLKMGAIGLAVNVPTVNLPPVISIKALASTNNLEADYEISASSDDGVPELFYAFGDADFPGTPNLTNPGVLTITRSTNAGDDKLVRIRAVAPSGKTTETQFSSDFDTLPDISNVASPSAIYDGSNQVGWRIQVTTDDDTRGIELTFMGGLSLRDIVGVTYIEPSTGVYWLDTDIVKSFALDLDQDPGQSGTISIRPYENSDYGAPGLGGETYSQTIGRAPITEVVIREPSRTDRDIIITPNPSTARVRYQVGGGGWQEVTGTATILGVYVGAGDVLLEYQGISSTGIPEQVRRLILDQDDDPEITSLVLSEPSASSLNVAVQVDEDLHTWVAWVKKGSAPRLVDGVTPDPVYRRFTGTRDQVTFNMYASAGTWYVLARAYDRRGNWTEETDSIVISGAATADVTNVRALRSTEGGLGYNDVLWDNSQPIIDAAGAFEVTLSEDGVVIVNNRDALLAHDNTAGGVNGGWHTAKALSSPGSSSDAVQLIFTYTVQLYDGVGALVSTKYAQVQGYYMGPDGSVRTIPLTAPPTPNVTVVDTGTRYFEVSWAAIHDGTGILLLCERETTPGVWLVEQDVMFLHTDPGMWVHGSGLNAKYRVSTQYRNYAGVGPRSGYEYIDFPGMAP